ncbi:hypothetical protein [Novacetimonas hansenii]|uniref:Uncharacterized protein n=1 Tax=Novacetimonas hansenii TaxID=436 RepID=A0AAW5EVT4_NOVHA|nr:hypothetical protein [Novacetimonas hansenii]MCJ8354862.1 hypothetical protein [Novacetimonas hansenii]
MDGALGGIARKAGQGVVRIFWKMHGFMKLFEKSFAKNFYTYSLETMTS